MVGIRSVDYREGLLRFPASVVVTVPAAGANIFAALNDCTRAEWVLATVTKLGVPHPWLCSLGALKAAGARGLLVGFGTPPIGGAASAGLVLFVVGASVTAMRAPWYSHLPYPAAWLGLAVGSRVLRLASPGAPPSVGASLGTCPVATRFRRGGGRRKRRGGGPRGAPKHHVIDRGEGRRA